jgi:hypothetical protein
MFTIVAENVRVIRGEQIPGTRGENIKHFEIEHQKVRAVFCDPEKAEEYIGKYLSGFSPGSKRCIKNCDFSLKGNTIEATSTVNSSGHLLLMFVKGLGS